MKAMELLDKSIEEMGNILTSDGFCKFTVSGGGISEEHDDYCSVYIDVNFKAGNIDRTTSLYICWDEKCGYGFECGEGCVIEEITPETLWKWLYFDIALEDLDEQYQA